MSVLIKGMKMPKNCIDCDFGWNGWCHRINSRAFIEVDMRRHDCPIIEVQPHGRLIDANALMLQVQEYIEEYGLDIDEHGFHSEKWCAMKETEMAINDAPTVIPADKDGEE